MLPELFKLLAHLHISLLNALVVPATAEAVVALLISCWHAAAVADLQLLLKLCSQPRAAKCCLCYAAHA